MKLPRGAVRSPEAAQAPKKTVFACDSYQGFPEEDVGRVDLGRLRFLSRVRGDIIKGYFSDTLPQFSDTPFCFIHLDRDIYSSYKECLQLLYENLTPGGVVVFDDYRAPKRPGEPPVEIFSSSTILDTKTV